MKIKVAASVVFSIFILFAARGIEKKPQWKGTIEEKDGVKVIKNPEVVDGVTVVKNPKEPMYPEKFIEFERELFIGDEEKGDNYIFTFARDIAVDSKRNIFFSFQMESV